MNAESRPRRLPQAPHWPRTRALRPPAVDAAVAFGLVCVFSEPGFDPYHHYSGPAWAAGGVTAAAALAWRRSRPVAVWLIATTLMRGFWPPGTETTGRPQPARAAPGAAPGPVYGDRVRDAEAGQLALLGSAAASWPRCWRGPSGRSRWRPRPRCWSRPGPWAKARARTGAGVAALRDRAAALESERAERDRRAAADERSRIARDMHDIVAHHVGVMTLHRRERPACWPSPGSHQAPSC